MPTAAATLTATATPCFRLEHLCATCGEHTLRPHDDSDVACYRMALADEERDARRW